MTEIKIFLQSFRLCEHNHHDSDSVENNLNEHFGKWLPINCCY